MKKTISVAALALCLGVATPAVAQDATGGFSAGVTGGTLGIGPEIGYRISKGLGVRANATFFDYNHDTESDGIEYEGNLDLKSFGAMLDVYPFGGGFRLSGGARVNNNRVGLTGTPSGTVEVGDDTFTQAEIGVLTGRVETKDLAPTLTLGWGGGLTKGLKLGIDAGVMFQGSPKVTQLSASGTAGNRPDVLAALADEAAEIEADLEDFDMYPVLQLSVGYRF
jgi:hypothetical protein